MPKDEAKERELAVEMSLYGHGRFDLQQFRKVRAAQDAECLKRDCMGTQTTCDSCECHKSQAVEFAELKKMICR